MVIVIVQVFLTGSYRFSTVFVVIGRSYRWQYGASAGSVGISARDLIGSQGISVRGLSVRKAYRCEACRSIGISAQSLSVRKAVRYELW